MIYKTLISGLLTASVGGICLIVTLLKEKASYNSIFNESRIYNIEAIVLQRFFGNTLKNSIINLHDQIEKYLKNPDTIQYQYDLYDIFLKTLKTRTVKDLLAEIKTQKSLFDLLMLSVYINQEEIKDIKDYDQSVKSLPGKLKKDYNELLDKLKSFNLNNKSSVIKIFSTMIESIKKFSVIDIESVESFPFIAIKLFITLAEIHSKVLENLEITLDRKKNGKNDLIEIINFISKNILGRNNNSSFNLLSA